MCGPQAGRRWVTGMEGDGGVVRAEARSGNGQFLWNGLSMDAGSLRCLLCLTVLSSLGAVHRTPNFTVSAPSAAVAQQVGKTAEEWRHRLAIEVASVLAYIQTDCRTRKTNSHHHHRRLQLRLVELEEQQHR